MTQEFSFQRISTSQMQTVELKKKYILQKILGYGQYGTVYKGVNQRTQETVAIKELRHSYKDQGINVQALREIEILKSIQCQQIVSFKDLACGENRTFIIMEYMEEDLLTALKRDTFSEQQAKMIMLQVLQGLAYLHNKGIIHRDIKPNNILNKNLEIKICDLGMAQNLKKLKPQTPRIQNHSYRAPEVFLGQKYCSKVDVWSAGVLFIQLLFKSNPFQGSSEHSCFQQILKYCGTPQEENWNGVTSLINYSTLIKEDPQPRILQTLLEKKMSPLLINLIDSMLTLDPSQRITAQDALQHPYFCGMNIERYFILINPYYTDALIKQMLAEKKAKLNNKLKQMSLTILMETKSLQFRKSSKKAKIAFDYSLILFSLNSVYQIIISFPQVFHNLQQQKQNLSTTSRNQIQRLYVIDLNHKIDIKEYNLEQSIVLAFLENLSTLNCQYCIFHQ
ncbi:unnamed protein product [Paramecium octaurelia]|uniref:Cyclin-dependent kinase 2 homolog n=1 Tax=Paramecium octaurelia TaxID=43137 RepID=A0A8S1SGC1_PAROT|nr:unnamed protein product [Paramecium octaurelia]